MKKHLLIGIPFLITYILVSAVFVYSYNTISYYNHSLKSLEALSSDSEDKEISLIDSQNNILETKILAKKYISNKNNLIESVLLSYKEEIHQPSIRNEIILAIAGILFILVNILLFGLYPSFSKGSNNALKRDAEKRRAP